MGWYVGLMIFVAVVATGAASGLTQTAGVPMNATTVPAGSLRGQGDPTSGGLGP
jgi:hypothetical protein